MTDAGPIDQAELVRLFGSEMPIEVVSLIWTCPPDMTLAEVRAEVRRIAADRPKIGMVERVARGLREKRVEGNPEFSKVRNTWEEMSERNQEHWMGLARAAIAAMRDADLEPIYAHIVERYPAMKGGGGIMRQIWIATIDAALREVP